MCALFVSAEREQYNIESKRAIKILAEDYMIAETWATKAIEWVLQAIGCSADNTHCGEIESSAEDSSFLPSKTDVDKGNAIAEYNIGLDYYYGRGVNPNCEHAVEYFMKAAEKGNVDAQKMLGVCYEKGQAIRQSWKKAAEFYKLAAEQGNLYAQINLGVCYENGKGVDQYYAEELGGI